MAHKAKERTSLLVIDDDAQIRKLLGRILAQQFDELGAVGTSREAERYLRCHPVTHLISDLNLGPNEPDGFAIVTRLRTNHPGIKKAVVFTGNPQTGWPLPAAVDRLVCKTGTLNELLNALGLVDA